MYLSNNYHGKNKYIIKYYNIYRINLLLTHKKTNILIICIFIKNNKIFISYKKNNFIYILFKNVYLTLKKTMNNKIKILI